MAMARDKGRERRDLLDLLVHGPHSAGFAAALAASSTQGFLAATWPLGAIEAIWRWPPLSDEGVL
jgi:hypothetical protein